MKTLKTKNLFSIVLIIFLTVFIITSCNKEEIPSIEEGNSKKELLQNKSHEGEEDYSVCNESRLSCDTLTDDGCNFLTGEGKDFSEQYLMVNMLNNCRTEALPSNCGWASGNITQTRTIQVDLNNCCSPASALNARLNGWKGLAVANKPNSSYLITSYQRTGGFMVTTYGPYRMNIKVTYRKKACQIVISHVPHQVASLYEQYLTKNYFSDAIRALGVDSMMQHKSTLKVEYNSKTPELTVVKEVFNDPQDLNPGINMKKIIIGNDEMPYGVYFVDLCTGDILNIEEKVIGNTGEGAGC